MTVEQVHPSYVLNCWITVFLSTLLSQLNHLWTLSGFHIYMISLLCSKQGAITAQLKYKISNNAYPYYFDTSFVYGCSL